MSGAWAARTAGGTRSATSVVRRASAKLIGRLPSVPTGVPRWLSPVRRESGKLVAEYASGVQTPRTADPSRRRFSPSALPARPGTSWGGVGPRHDGPGPCPDAGAPAGRRDPFAAIGPPSAGRGLSVPPAFVPSLSLGRGLSARREGARPRRLGRAAGDRAHPDPARPRGLRTGGPRGPNGDRGRCPLRPQLSR